MVVQGLRNLLQWLSGLKEEFFFSPLIIYNTLKKKPQKTLKSDNAAQQRFKVPAKANQTLCPSVRSQKVLAKTKGGFYFEATLVYFFLPRLV